VPLASALLLAGCGGPASILAPEGPIASADLAILLNALVIMLVIVVPTILATLGVAWWYRAGNARAHYRPNFVYSGRVELIVWSIPIMVILFLGGVIWIGSHDLDPGQPIPSRQPPLEVQVVSLNWAWLFIYPGQQVASLNALALPVGVPVHLRLTSASVMNSFFVPRLGSQIYAMNGMETQLNLRADRAGQFYGQSAHFSGDGFSDMHFAVQALPGVGFAQWVKAAQASRSILEDRSYADLVRQHRPTAPSTMRAPQGTLFDAVVAQHIAPAPGPQAGPGGHAQSAPSSSGASHHAG
jgi:cytochrome o ubiquinol oxidase subunit 2